MQCFPKKKNKEKKKKNSDHSQPHMTLPKVYQMCKERQNEREPERRTKKKKSNNNKKKNNKFD